MTDFAAIDFETANKERSSVCSVGIVIVRNGGITEKLYRLIRPYPNYYSYWNTQVHGLTFQDTACAPTFPEVWKEIDPIIAGLPLVAHNSPFDEGCLKAAFQAYNMEYPGYTFHCTCRVNPAKRNAMVVKNEKRFLKQKRNALKNPGYSHHPVKTQASFKRLLKAV